MSSSREPEPGLQQPEWLVEALRRHEAPLLRYAASITGDRERARDVVQETFLRLCAQPPAPGRLDSAPDLEHLSRWLFTVCRNHALDVLRKETRVTSLDDPDHLSRPAAGASSRPHDADPAERLESQEDLERVRDALASLPATQQEVVRLKFQAGLSYREIAEVTGETITNVGTLLHVALKTVRGRLRVEPRAAPRSDPAPASRAAPNAVPARA